ncbi:hypothetical protein Vadar_032207 [Vaccinium darrowii]|uniref:Uncharacterized protein n=1 Tax=Vaccinium darrowii TaxID=229202 RepID=A0ACB7Z8X4_9ERIC|nr:hypothetical protein Vadar_032207 [Vaccinium darrowii]
MLTGDNFSDWKESILLSLGCSELDLALREDAPPALTESSTPAENLKHERANRYTSSEVADFAEAAMPPNYGWKKSAFGIAPDFGAIFMSNRSTIDECFKRNLFGLPHAFAEFVKEVKAGMILFLFDAYHSTGKKFPAQVRFSVIWNCRPLSERDFRDAIRENYFAAWKFNIGLSKDQVQRLLYLFQSTMVRVQKSMRKKNVKKMDSNASAKVYNSIDSTEDSLVESQATKPVDLPQTLNERTSRFQHPFTTGTSNLFTSLHEYITHSSDAIATSCFSGCQQVQLERESEHIVVSSYTTSSGLGDYIPLSSPDKFEPRETGQASGLERESEHIVVSSYTTSSGLGDYIPLSSPDQFEPRETGQAFSEATFDGKKDSSFAEACISPMSFGVRDSTQPSSVFNADRGQCDESSPVHQSDNYPRVKGLYSDIPNQKGTVFSRLNLELKASIEKNEDNSEVTESVHEIMKKLQQSHKKWEKATRKTKSVIHSTLKNRPSVFSRLGSASKDIRRKDVNTQLENRAAERCSSKKTKRGYEVSIKHYGDAKKWNTWTRETGGKDHADGAMGSSENRQKKRRLVSLVIRDELDVNSEISNRWCPELQMQPQESSVGKERGGSCEGSTKSDKSCDNEIGFSPKDIVLSVTYPTTSDGKGEEQGRGLTNMDLMLGIVNGSITNCFDEVGPKPLKTYQRRDRVCNTEPVFSS